MVRATTRIQSEVRPVTEVAIAVRGDPVAESISSGDATGAGEALEVEHIPLLFCEATLCCKGCELVESGFIVAVANEIWLHYVRRYKVSS